MKIKIILAVSLFAFLFSCTENKKDSNSSVIDSTKVQADTLSIKIKVISDKILEDPNNAELYFQRAKVYQANKVYNSAVNDMDRVMKLDSSKAEYYLYFADLYFMTNKTRNSKEMFERCIKQFPQNIEARLKLAELYYLVKKYQESINYINEALKIDKYNARGYFMKGLNYQEMGDTAKAVSSMQTAVEQDADYYDAYLHLGLLYAGKKNRLAVDYYNNAIKIQPNSIEAYYDRGKFFQDIGDYRSAENDYNIILKINPNYKFAHFNLGVVCLLRDDKSAEEALKHFDNAIKIDSQYFQAYFGRGTAYQALEQMQKALDDYRVTLQINPNFTPALEAVKSINQSKK